MAALPAIIVRQQSWVVLTGVVGQLARAMGRRNMARSAVRGRFIFLAMVEAREGFKVENKIQMDYGTQNSGYSADEIIRSWERHGLSNVGAGDIR